MSFPKQNEIELPLLKALHDLGGKAEPKELYPRLAKIFTQLTEEVLAARLPSSPSTFRWHNLVQWSRQRSLPGYGVSSSCGASLSEANWRVQSGNQEKERISEIEGRAATAPAKRARAAN